MQADLGSAMPTSGGLYYWTFYYANAKSRRALSFLVGYSNTLGLVGGLCSIDYGFSLMFMSVIVIATDGAFEPSYGMVYAVFLACVLLHAILASTLQRIMVSSASMHLASTEQWFCALGEAPNRVRNSQLRPYFRYNHRAAHWSGSESQ